MQKYLSNLEEAMKQEGLSEEVIKEVLSDHEEMITAAMEEGVQEEDLTEKFGNPEDIARAISMDNIEEDTSGEEQGYRLLKAFDLKGEHIEVEGKLLNESISFTRGKGTGIEVFVKDMPKESDYTVKCDGETLTIKRTTKLFFSFGQKQSAKFRINIPANILIKNADINITNGKISMKKLMSQNLKLKTVNGKISLKDMTNDNDHLTSVNGKIKLYDVTANKTFVSQVSGSTKMKNTTVQNEVYIRSVSGDVELKDVTATDIEYHSVSGSLKGKEVYPKTLSLKSVSGDIYIKNSNKEHKIKIKNKQSLSGKITLE